MAPISKIPLDTLRAFESAARHGSFVGAGRELNVTPAAVSHRVKALESALGVPLFTRLARGIDLTDAGRRYCREIASALRQIDRATTSVGQATVEGPLKVSLPESTARFWLLPRLARLADYAPGIELSVEADSRLSALSDGDADIAIRFGGGTYPGFDSQLLFGDAVTIVASRSAVSQFVDNRAPAILRHSTLLEDYGAADAEPWMHWTSWLREAGMAHADSEATLRFSNSALTVSACVAGTGICIGRMSLVFGLIAGHELQPILPWRTTEMAHYLVMPPAAAHNPRVVAFRGWLQDEIVRYLAEVHKLTGIALPPVRPD